MNNHRYQQTVEYANVDTINITDLVPGTYLLNVGPRQWTWISNCNIGVMQLAKQTTTSTYSDLISITWLKQDSGAPAISWTYTGGSPIYPSNHKWTMTCKWSSKGNYGLGFIKLF